jgi:hypothetical protein
MLRLVVVLVVVGVREVGDVRRRSMTYAAKRAGLVDDASAKRRRFGAACRRRGPGRRRRVGGPRGDVASRRAGHISRTGPTCADRPGTSISAPPGSGARRAVRGYLPRHKSRRVPSWVMTRMRVCQQCEEGFEAATTGRPAKFCSATCRKKAWETARIRQAVVVEVAKAVAAERRRANRGNETPASRGNRGNETPAQTGARAPDPRTAWQTEPPLVRERAEPPAVPPRPRRSSGTALPLPGLEVDGG